MMKAPTSPHEYSTFAPTPSWSSNQQLQAIPSSLESDAEFLVTLLQQSTHQRDDIYRRFLGTGNETSNARRLLTMWLDHFLCREIGVLNSMNYVLVFARFAALWHVHYVLHFYSNDISTLDRYRHHLSLGLDFDHVNDNPCLCATLYHVFKFQADAGKPSNDIKFSVSAETETTSTPVHMLWDIARLVRVIKMMKVDVILQVLEVLVCNLEIIIGRSPQATTSITLDWKHAVRDSIMERGSSTQFQGTILWRQCPFGGSH